MMSLPHWLLRLYEALGALALAIFLCTVLLMFSGCASITEYRQQRELLMAPEPLNTVEAKRVIGTLYASNMAVAQVDRSAVPAFVDAGIARAALSCGDWLSRISANKRNAMFTDHQMGVASALIQTLEGIAKASSATVAVTGALSVAAQGVMTNIQTDLLTAPAPYQVQAALLGMLNDCSEKLRADAASLSFGQAFVRLETCARTCSYEAAAATATNALANTTTTVNPTSGALTTTAVTSAAVKDDAGAKLLAYWRPNGTVDKAAEAQIKAWQRQNGVDVSIPMLARGSLYAAARAKAVVDLGIGP